jgi:PAS domain S-box-containing protein
VSQPGPLSERAVILAPIGRDGAVAVQVLIEAGIPAQAVATLPSLYDEIEKGCGVAVIADEAIETADLRPLVSFLQRQPAWSDFPIILLTRRGGGLERNPAAGRFAELLGNVIFLERPFHPTTLASVVRTAQRGRRRQYEARQRLEDLAESEQRLQTALNAGRLGSWSLEATDRLLTTSDSTRQHFGRDPTESFTYEDLCAAVHPDDQTRMQAALQRTLRTGEDYVIEYRNIWPDNTVHWIDVRARAVRASSGKVVQVVGVSSDISARKNLDLERERLLTDLAAERAALANLTETLEQRIEARTKELMIEIADREKAQEQLRQLQKVESIGHLTGGVAHDFNNLLMAVIGNLEVLKKRVPDDTRSQRLIESAMQAADRGASLTQRLLAFSRQQRLALAPTDLVALLHGMRNLLDRSLGPLTSVQIEAPKGLPHALVDANQLELAILNLAINARDAMPEEGQITIRLSQVTIAEGQQLQPGLYLRVQVIDTGTGMDEATLAKAVDPFFSTKPIGKGTGLGLSMVHGLALQLGGRLELSSEIGKGTIANLWLPTAKTRQESAQVIPLARAVAARPATILVVDDDPLIALSTVDMLDDLGHTVIEANSGKRALEILEAGEPIDLMITDQAMPNMTGVELAEVARRMRPELPVLLATGYADLSIGAKINLPLLSKPYRQAELQAQIERLLQRVRSS